MSKSTNSKTAHSKALRSKTAAQWQKEKIATGELATISQTIGPGQNINKIKAELAKIAKEQGNKSRWEVLELLIDFYNENQVK